ncbi:MAG TPA: TAT-variant-translocated molybdopterin oxidoreductase [Verrucomicrobiae bacterium]
MSKTIPPICPEPEAGRRYWRSLDQLAETPEFKDWLQREFPSGASEWDDAVSRRHFMKIMSASFMLAGIGLAAGCRQKEEHVTPFGKAQENYIHGNPQFYATAMPTRGSAVPLVVKSNEGRPTKIEGNAQHPDSNGGTDRFAQASILGLYDPDRAQRFTHNGNNVSAEAAMDFLTELSKKAAVTDGQGLSFLLESSNSPSRRRLQKLISKKFSKAKWYVYDPVDLDIHRRAATQAFGQSVKPYYKYDAAKVIVSLDCDFLGAEDDVHTNIRRFAQSRRVDSPEDKEKMSRLYVIESLMTLTGANADHRLRVAISLVGQIAVALTGAINGKTASAVAGVDPKWISECAKDLAANRGDSLVVAGYGQPLLVHLLAQQLNSLLGNVGKTVVYHSVPEQSEGLLGDLAKSLNAGEVETLVVLGGNPAYNAPVDLNWAATQRKAKTVVRLASYEDETFAATDWSFPAAHYLESWGDARTGDGTIVPIQPLIAPLFGGLSELEVLARIAGDSATSPYEIVRATLSEMLNGGGGEEAWKKFLFDGFLAGSAARPVSVIYKDTGWPATALQDVPSSDKLEVIFHRDYSVDDGRYNNNGWLQELPNPITKLVWDNAVLISRKTAKALGVKNYDLVEVSLFGKTVNGPIWIQPGMAENVIGLALGYGREKAGRVGSGAGFNAYKLRTAAAQNFAVGATIKNLGKTFPLSCTQDHWSMEGRPVIREANLEQFKKHADFAEKMDAPLPPGGNRSFYPNPLDEAKKTAHHQWGMAIDLNMCVGCSSCMIACQSENNVPIVGKDLVKRGRDMHWIRLDRYYSGAPKGRKFTDVFRKDEEQQFDEWIDDPQVVTQPMLCQHCESAPCESVCPVNATVHDQEGLNVMVYNRCVGTRYCSNNCPYKVRRFNYLDYNKRPLDTLKGPRYATPLLHKTDGQWDLLNWWKDPQDPTKGMRESDEWDLIKMVKNPDVTVRMRGVMEKCTFCIQRIEGAKIAAKVKAGASGDVIVPDGTFTTACAQACPAGAFEFGNIADPNSRVAKLKESTRNYSVLEFLLTKPRTTYLARVRNPNPAMPDYYESPLSLEEYEQKAGNPFEQREEHNEAEPAGKEHQHG